MARVTEHQIPVTLNGPKVDAVLVEPDNATALLVLGHGAGSPIHVLLMVQMAAALADHGVATFRYNYPHSQGGTVCREDLVDPLDLLLTTTTSAVTKAEALELGLPLFLGGRSMSSQVVTLALTREAWPAIRGVVLYVFPMRWHLLLGDTVSHPHEVSVPMLFVQGSRDELTDLRELRTVLDGLGSNASLHVVEGADHSYDLPAESGRTRPDSLRKVAAVTAAWMQSRGIDANHSRPNLAQHPPARPHWPRERRWPEVR